MCSKALFLRKKSTGLNSIEELAYSLASRISGLKVIGIIYFRLVTHLYRINTFYWIAGVKTPCYFYKLDE